MEGGQSSVRPDAEHRAMTVDSSGNGGAIEITVPGQRQCAWLRAIAVRFCRIADGPAGMGDDQAEAVEERKRALTGDPEDGSASIGSSR